ALVMAASHSPHQIIQNIFPVAGRQIS
ncbi:hypothetical protein K8W72_004404, partial [Salmonella enterica]|nr:hypothetical protein [Salmonella enterica]ECV9908038.1 hypothetical protein [Salmonella enterica subsp. enterica]EDR7243071.1 hypothetical protein [Salmonella enterica subsp. enterica serovar 4,[5],12:i:-]EEE9881033.1 hypothetical protein [Salmonella enterica subsp. enterica serovar Typhimurium]EHQ7008185.1 hypothetical protein [Salmonella enterica subsp. houtenae serovar 50:z4,z23:-]HEC9825012.1 hypothetical protein [Salmonella enterica subsp. enterica serovar Mississippi]